MNKTELVAAMAEHAEMTKKDAEKALTAFTEVVAKELKKGEKIQLEGFGTLRFLREQLEKAEILRQVRRCRLRRPRRRSSSQARH